MKILLIVAVIALIYITIKYILYRRQIKNICRQLKFLSENETNYRIRTDVKEKEILSLAELLNDINDKNSKREIYLQKTRPFGPVWCERRGAGVRWTPLCAAQKHRPRRQPRP